MTYILVGIAGALGAVCRYLIGLALFTGSTFPFSTVIINLLGSFLLAWLTTVVFSRGFLSPRVTSAIGTGFVGSFTTFSTFSVETIDLFRSEHIFLGIIYILVSVFGGLFMSRLGFRGDRKEREES